jgi:mRNA interferase MazF
VYWVDLGHRRKPWPVVANNVRNRTLGSCLAARVTTTRKPALPSIVQLPNGEPAVGYVVCDDIAALERHELDKLAGAVSPATMTRVNGALHAALALD